MMVPVLVTLLMAAGPDPTRGQAQGTLVLDGHTVTLTHAYGRLNDDGEVEVRLADRALPADDPEVSLEIAGRMGGADGLQFTLTDKGADRWLVSTSPWGGGGCGGYCDAALVFEPTSRTDAQVSGRAFTRGVADIVGHKVQIDARFTADIRRYVEPKAADSAQEMARRELREKGYKFSRRDYFSAAYSQPDLVETFFRAGMPVNATNVETGRTLLIATLFEIQECDEPRANQLVRTLLRAKADPNEVEADGRP